MQEGQNFSSESRNLSGLHFQYILNAPLPPNVRIPIFQGQNLLVPNLRPKKFRGPICPPKKFRGPICLEAHTPLWQGRKVSEIHFLRGEASLIFPPIGKGVPMPHQCSGCNTPAPVFDICQYSINLTFYTNTNAGYHSWTNIFAQSFKSECRTSAALRPKPRVSQTKWDAASITLIR